MAELNFLPSALAERLPDALGEATRKEWLALEAVLEDARLEEQELALSVALAPLKASEPLLVSLASR